MSQSGWETEQWIFLGSGTYNEAYRSRDGNFVLKIHKPPKGEKYKVADKPERSVRLWNELNLPKYPAFVVEKTTKGRGWICPFIEGTAPTDKEISDCVIDIFNKTGRIVLDAPAKGENFIKTTEGNVVCIDVGMALEMESRDKVIYKGGTIRRKSVDSPKVWESVASDYPRFFDVSESTKPQTTNTIRALLFIKEHRPNIIDASYLKQDSQLINCLALAYKTKIYVSAALSKLDRHIPPAQITDTDNLKNAKELCVEELKKYINSRGTEDKNGLFTPSFVTRWFRDSALTCSKVAYAKNLIKQLENACSLDDMTQSINQIKASPKALASKFTSGLGAVLTSCLKMVDEKRDGLENEGHSATLGNQ